MIDVWTPHAFLLNEAPGGWGAGVPPGFEHDHGDAVTISNFANTYNINIFSQRVINFRSWMKSNGEQNKPLWITEYGSLFPPIDKPGGSDRENVSDASTSAYMLKTFDFMLNTADANSGFPDDNNQLVQRWFWYSLNDYRYHMGGSLFDPDNHPPTITDVGTAFLNYTSTISVNPEFHFSGNIGLQPDATDATKFDVVFSIRNAGNSVTQSPRLWVYQDNPNRSPYAQVDTPPVIGCGETTGEEIAIPYPPSPTSSNKLYLRLDTNGNLTQDDGDEIVSLTAPPYPGTLTANPLSYSRIALSWQSAHGQDGYKIQRSGDGGASWTEIASVGKSVTSYSDTDTALQCAHPYQYRVQAYDSRGNWGFSNTVSVSTDSCAVLAISAQSVSQVRINLSWPNPYHTPTSISIERSPDGSNAWSEIGTVPGNATGYSDKSLSCAQPYYYRVRAESNYNGVVDYWNYSNTASATTGICTAPPTPLGLAVQARTSTSIRLNWTDQDGEDQYWIERSPDGSSGWSQVGIVLRDVTTFVDNNLAPGTTYYYRLRSWNALGTSGYSDVQSGKDFLYDIFLPFMTNQ